MPECGSLAAWPALVHISGRGRRLVHIRVPAKLTEVEEGRSHVGYEWAVSLQEGGRGDLIPEGSQSVGDTRGRCWLPRYQTGSTGHSDPRLAGRQAGRLAGWVGALEVGANSYARDGTHNRLVSSSTSSVPLLGLSFSPGNKREKRQDCHGRLKTEIEIVHLLVNDRGLIPRGRASGL